MRGRNILFWQRLLSVALLALVLWRRLPTPYSSDATPGDDNDPPADNELDHNASLQTVSRRLFMVTACILLLTVILFIPALMGGRFLVSWFSFGAAVLGGFVSMQQRLKEMSGQELRLLSMSWSQVILYPLVAGIFGLILYLLTLSGLLQGSLFPHYSVPKFESPVTYGQFKTFLLTTYPASGADFAKLAIWTFVAGFSERFVPDVLDGLAKRKV